MTQQYVDRETRTALISRMGEAGVRQADVAKKLGWNEGKLSRVLRGRVRMPEGFTDSFARAVRETARERLDAAVFGGNGSGTPSPC